VADPIPGEWLSAAALAIESQPAGSSAAHLARVALEAAVPLMRARAEGTETQWGLRLTGESGEPIYDAYPDEQTARSMITTFQGVFDTVVVRRELGPWKEPDDGQVP
jgi:hypothetical protein